MDPILCEPRGAIGPRRESRGAITCFVVSHFDEFNDAFEFIEAFFHWPL